MKNDDVLALITARGGSKRLPGKNTKALGGSPLISWTIREALKAKYITRLIISTDDEKAAKIARDEGCAVPFMRPPALAGDHSTSFDVAKHALEALENRYKWLVLLQPTSPFRSAADIDACVDMAINNNANSVISVCQSHPSYVMHFTKDERGLLKSPYGMSIKDLNHTRSQEMPDTFHINGAVYVVNVDWFLESRAFFDDETLAWEMPASRSVNIDTHEDWAMAEFFLTYQRGV